MLVILGILGPLQMIEQELLLLDFRKFLFRYAFQHVSFQTPSSLYKALLQSDAEFSTLLNSSVEIPRNSCKVQFNNCHIKLGMPGIFLSCFALRHQKS